MIITNNRIASTTTDTASTLKRVRPRPPVKAFNRSKYGEATVMRRLPLSIVPAVNKLVAQRLAVNKAGDPDTW
jgi:hypothetical protein